MAVRYDLEVDQGSTFTRSFAWTNPDGSAIDITGARAQLRAQPGADVLADLDSEPGGGLVIAPGSGTVVLTITAAASRAWAFTAAGWDLLVWNATDDKRLAEGVVKVSRQVTVR